MCGRYVSPDQASIEREFNLLRAEWQFPANFNVAPSLMIPAIRAARGEQQGVLLRWGLIPDFARGIAGRYATFNARIETLATSASFRGSWQRGQRCIIPALGFYEWHVNTDGSKQPFYIHLNDQDVFGFAGLWERSSLDANTVTESCSIITMPANDLMSEIHNGRSRMPAILAREQRAAWLFGDAEAAGASLAAYPDHLMVAYAVSPRVNSARNNDENLIEPLVTDDD